ncbi:MAG: M14 family metallocarboxypeptidase [Desulfobacterales bacterium]|nr:MAG: M14 family metallocarboxypeptidase [Desulfobacterales bacterium]
MIKRVLLCSLAILITYCASGHHSPFENDIVPARDLSEIEKRIQRAVSSSPHLLIKNIGHVDYGNFQAPIWCVSFRPQQPISFKILINAGIHGDEPAGVYYAMELMETLAKNPGLYPGTAFDIIPVVNPWGLTHDIRFNQDGIDINRDFTTLHSQEAKIVHTFVGERQWDLMLDLHEDPSASGFYIYQYGQPDKITSEKVVAAVEELGYPIEENVNMVILNTDHGIIDAPMWGLWYMRLTGQLSIANYYRLYNSPHVFTVETPTAPPVENRLSMHRTAVQLLIQEHQILK